jgi:uncharacterized protein (DUF433 family)
VPESHKRSIYSAVWIRKFNLTLGNASSAFEGIDILETMATTTEIGSLISRHPGLRGGRPCVAGTGVSVRRIAQWHNMGLIPEEIARKLGHLSLAQVHAALAYYHANQPEIDADLDAEAREAEALEQQHHR